jgi:glycosyltransferase involved in cell wall biosynthesis
MDQVVCVSHAQAKKARAAGAKAQRTRVIHNAVDPERFADPGPRYRTKLERYFRTPRRRIIGAAGRLSPEKGYAVLVAAAEQLLQEDPSLGFVVFGEGPRRAELLQQINEAGLAGSFILPGFRADLDCFIPHLDLMVLPSFTEGLPNVLLEAFAAGVPVVATAVGGTPELVEDGVSGYLVPPGDPGKLADGIRQALTGDEHPRELGFQGRQRVLEEFSFRAQAERYQALFAELCGAPAPSAEPDLVPSPSLLVETEPLCER